MPDYKKMYLKLIEASEQAMRIMNEALCACEMLAICAQDPHLQVLPLHVIEHEGETES